MFKQRVYWHHTVEMRSDKVLTRLPPKVDTAIIGGGYTGLNSGNPWFLPLIGSWCKFLDWIG